MVERDEPSPEQIEIYKKMSMEEKWRVACNLIDSARRLKGDYLRSIHPEWSEEEVKKAVRDWFMHASD